MAEARTARLVSPVNLWPATSNSGMPGVPPEGAKEILQRMDLPLKDAVAIYSQARRASEV